MLGATVQVNYQDERKFAQRPRRWHGPGGRSLIWNGGRTTRRAQPAAGGIILPPYTGQFSYTALDGSTKPMSPRYWGMDHWAARVGQGTYLNWVVGNAILPPEDPNPSDQGIEIVDRTTVPELAELPADGGRLGK